MRRKIKKTAQTINYARTKIIGGANYTSDSFFEWN